MFAGQGVERSTLPPPLNAAGWRRVVERLRPYVHSLRLTGGEPTLHPQFADIVRWLDDLPLPFSVFTNGRWAEPERMIDLFSSTDHLRSLLISLHGADEAQHAAFCGIDGAFEETMDNVRRAVEAGLPVNTSTVITIHNVTSVAAIARLSHALGAGAAVFNRLIGETRGAPTPQQLRVAVREVERMRAAGANVELGPCVPPCFVPNSSEGCLAGLAFWTVDPWGNVRPCNHTPLKCGNLLEQSVTEIVEGAAMSRWHDMIPEVCLDCAAYARCHGGCRAQALLLARDQDDLMRIPLEEGPASPRTMNLPGARRPVARFESRDESFGRLLIRGGAILPVSDQANELLDRLDGSLTLAEIEAHFGSGALALVGLLVHKGLVELKGPDTRVKP